MRFLLFISFLILASACKIGVIQKKRYYDNGSLMKCFYVLRSDSTKLDGLYRSYYQDGQLTSEMHFKNGIEHGYSKNYHPNGNLFAEYYKRNGLYEGDFKEYHKNGKLFYHIEYKNGLLWNIKGILDQNGKQLDPGTLQNGTGIAKKYDENGKISGEGILINGKKEGYWKIYTSKGFVDSISYENGLVEGKYNDVYGY